MVSHCSSEAVGHGPEGFQGVVTGWRLPGRRACSGEDSWACLMCAHREIIHDRGNGGSNHES